jgi:L-ascorbate metabolism protein UlaG (beta-lactamase superfamily)
MKIKHFLYNAFIIEDRKTKIAIDPGTSLGLFKMYSLIPEVEWTNVNHVVISHNDADHYKFALPMAKKSNAKVICGKDLVNDFASQHIDEVHSIEVNDVIELDNVKYEGLKVEHGTLYFKLGGGLIEMKIMLCKRNKGGQEIYLGPLRVNKVEKDLCVFNHATIKLLFGLIRAEKDNVDWALGSIGYKISIGDKTLINLGDTILKNDWKGLKPDVLMIPIGGLGSNTWTMDVPEALIAVKSIAPKLVIPCHYAAPFLWRKKFCPADDKLFKREVEKMGIKCEIMKYGDEIVI